MPESIGPVRPVGHGAGGGGRQPPPGEERRRKKRRKQETRPLPPEETRPQATPASKSKTGDDEEKGQHLDIKI